MTWKKHFKPVNSVLPNQHRGTGTGSTHTAISNFSTWLPEVYLGPPNRLQRYVQYEQMDLDQEVQGALNTIAEFSTMNDPKTGLPFVINYHDEPSPTESKILEKTLKQWCHLNEFNKRIFNIFRQTLVYGDQFFIRDPQNFKLYWVDPGTVEKVMVNESEGKKPEIYFVRDLDLNLGELVATNMQFKNQIGYNTTDMVFPQSQLGSQSTTNTGYSTANYGGTGGASDDSATVPVDAEHVVHISMTDGMNSAWPFGISILENIFKVHKQKELLEDSVLIYRIHRAPERRVFFIDVGTMPPQKAQQYLERIKLEVQQKRIPSRTGSGQSISDSSYNPMCIGLDTKIPLMDGRVLTLAEIIEEYEAGKTLYAYSCDPNTGRLAPGLISWAGVTRRNADLVRIRFSGTRELLCTYDHKIPVVGRGRVEAQDLERGDKLIPFHRYTDLDEPPGGYDLDKNNNIIYDMSYNTWRRGDQLCKLHGIDDNHAMLHESLPRKAPKFKHRNFAHFDISPRTMKHIIRFYQEHPGLLLDEFLTLLNRDPLYKQFIAEDNINNTTRGTNPVNLDMNVIKFNGVYKTFGFVSYNDFVSKVMHSATEVKEVQFIKRKADVGTLTIDQDEKYHDYHTFALEIGFFVCNSMLEDFYFATNSESRGSRVETLPGGENLGCFALDTKVKMLDGRELTIVEIEKELDDGETLYTTSCDPTGNTIKPGLITWAGKTRDNEEVVEIVLSNGNTITCTYDHEFPVKYKGFVEAKDLSIGDLMVEIDPDGENIYVQNINNIEETMDVGTLSIDEDEIEHDFHTYALSAGIFTKNSIDDLKYFNNKMIRGLGVPSSYLPTGPDDGTATMNDGRLGTAFIQEFRFSKTCERHQMRIIENLDLEFKLFLKHRGINIDNALFDISFTTPQSFSDYREIERDSAQLSVYTSAADIPFISKRYALKRYLKWTDDEILENERMWEEENGGASTPPEEGGGLGGAGISGSDLAPEDLGEFDMGEGTEGEDMGDLGDLGEEPPPQP